MTQTGRKRERDCLGGPHPLQDKKVLASRSSVAWQPGRQARASQIFEFKQKERKDIIYYIVAALLWLGWILFCSDFIAK